MPNLVRYTALTGLALLATISFANFVLHPSTGATFIGAAPKPVVAAAMAGREVRRWRNERAPAAVAEGRKALEQIGAMQESAPPLPNSARTVAASPPMRAAPAALQDRPDPTDDEAARAAKAAKAKINAERERARRSARERTRQRQVLVRKQEMSAQQRGGFFQQPDPARPHAFGWGKIAGERGVRGGAGQGL